MAEDRRKRKSREALKTALLLLMKKKELSGITIRELCETADLNRSTFYANYTDIPSLFRAICDDVFDKMFETLESSWSSLYEEGRIHRPEAVAAMLEYMLQQQELFRLLLKQDNSVPFTRQMTDYCSRKFLLDREPPAARYLALYHTIGSFTVIRQWLEDNTPLHAMELAKLICHQSAATSPRFDGSGPK